MNNRIKKSKDLEVGKYYRSVIDGECAVINRFDENNDPIGVLIHCFSDYLCTSFTDLHLFFDDLSVIEEITQEEFEQKLQEAQEEFIKMTNKIKNKENENI